MKRLLFVFLLLLSNFSFAQDYQWLISSYPNLYSGSTPEAAFAAYHAAKFGSWQYKITDRTVVDQNNVRFTFNNGANPSSWTNVGLTVSTSRDGSGCTLPKVWNTTTLSCQIPAGNDYEFCNGKNADSTNPEIWLNGACVEVYRQDRPTQCKYYSRRDSGIATATKVTFNTAVKGPINGETVAMDNLSCKIKVTSSTCTINADGQSTVCLVNGTYTGDTSGGSDDPKAQDCRTQGGCVAVDPTPKTDTNNKPCNYTAGAGGSQTCTSKQETKTSGSQNCGTVNGTYGCTWNSPTSKGIDITTGITTTNNPDGSTTAVKTDVSTKTVCTDMNVCSSVTTTTKTTTTKDGNGVLISSSSTCSGAACGTGSASNGTGTGSGNGSGEGEGNGSGDCVTAEECADGSSPNTPKMDKVDDYQQTTQKFYDSVKGSPIATAVGNISAPDTGVAPTLTTPAIQALGGTSLDFGIIRDQKSIIDDVMRPTMRAFWCFVAVLIFLMA